MRMMARCNSNVTVHEQGLGERRCISESNSGGADYTTAMTMDDESDEWLIER
jgi:hypothetical protein